MEGKARAMEGKRKAEACPGEDVVKASPWIDEDHLLDLKWKLFDRRQELYKFLKGSKMPLELKGSEPDAEDDKVFSFRKRWITEWFDKCWSLELTTKTPAMPFTMTRAPKCAYPCDALQIFTVRVLKVGCGLDWPLHVFGTIAVRDSADNNRNIVYCRTRDNCQTLTQQNSRLTLTGPSRAVVLDPKTKLVTLEVELKVKGINETEDKYLCFVAEQISPGNLFLKSKNNLLEFKLSNVTDSVEATIFIRVVKGCWPNGISGHINACFENEHIPLLEFDESDTSPVSDDGYLELSRHVVSIGVDHELHLNLCATPVGMSSRRFKAAKNGHSVANFDLGTFELEVLVAWSLVSPVLNGTLSWT